MENRADVVKVVQESGIKTKEIAKPNTEKCENSDKSNMDIDKINVRVCDKKSEPVRTSKKDGGEKMTSRSGTRESRSSRKRKDSNDSRSAKRLKLESGSAGAKPNLLLGDGEASVELDKTKKKAGVSQHFSSSEKSRVTELVVKHLMPTYRSKKFIRDREHFKSIAREISKSLMGANGTKTS